jgi:hypothetical protein
MSGVIILETHSLFREVGMNGEGLLVGAVLVLVVLRAIHTLAFRIEFGIWPWEREKAEREVEASLTNARSFDRQLKVIIIATKAGYGGTVVSFMRRLMRQRTYADNEPDI